LQLSGGADSGLFIHVESATFSFRALKFVMYGPKRIIRGLKNRTVRLLFRFLLSSLVMSTGRNMEKLGSRQGGWVVPTDMIKPEWICYCGGVGEDVTFDLALIDRFGCEVYAFDPTPRAISHAARSAANNPRFHFYPYGLWSADTELKFYASRNPQLVNHSAVNLQGTSSYFVAPCKRISTIIKELGHDRIDLLKIDIEGSEYEVLDSLIEDDLRFIKVLCVEFDQPMPIVGIYRMARKIIRWGYSLASIDAWNYTFIKRELN
jgi:FkbM family methyltransferase